MSGTCFSGSCSKQNGAALAAPFEPCVSGGDQFGAVGRHARPQLVGEADRGAWASAIESLIGDPDRLGDLARRGRARAESVYAWPVVAREHLNFFKELTL